MLNADFFTIEDRAWETNFFDKNWGLLKFTHTLTSLTDLALISENLKSFLDRIDGQYQLIEMKLPANLILLSPILEDVGFRLVDTQICFKTLIFQKNIQEQNFLLSKDSDYSIRMYKENDLGSIIELTDRCLINDLNFVSRFKNPIFFSKKDTLKYFEASIRKSIMLKNTICAVLIDTQERIKGYFIYERRLDGCGKVVYKGILSVIDFNARGEKAHLALQSYLFSSIDDVEFYLDNTTQLSNTPVIKNHIRSQRTLEDISLIFMRKRTNSINSE